MLEKKTIQFKCNVIVCVLRTSNAYTTYKMLLNLHQLLVFQFVIHSNAIASYLNWHGIKIDHQCLPCHLSTNDCHYVLTCILQCFASNWMCIIRTVCYHSCVHIQYFVYMICAEFQNCSCKCFQCVVFVRPTGSTFNVCMCLCSYYCISLIRELLVDLSSCILCGGIFEYQNRVLIDANFCCVIWCSIQIRNR